MKKILLGFFILYGSIVLGQEKIIELDHKFNQPYLIKENQSYNITDVDNLWTIIKHKKELIVYHFNGNNELIKKLTIDLPIKYFENLKGYYVTQNSLILFSNTSRFKKISALKIRKSDYSVETSFKKFDINKDVVFTSFTNNNIYYILASTNNSDIVNLYKINEDLTYSKKILNFPRIRNRKDDKPDKSAGSVFLHDLNWHITDDNSLVKIRHDLPNDNSLVRIQHNLPNSLFETSSKIKMFSFNDKLVFSFDNSFKSTMIVFVDLSNYNVSFQDVEKTNLDGKIRRHNSYILDDKIVQIITDDNEVVVEFKEIKTKQKIKEFRIDIQDSISFKNSSIIQDGNTSEYTGAKRREFESSSKFIRKINSSHVGLSLYNVGNEYYSLLIGGYKLPQDGYKVGETNVKLDVNKSFNFSLKEFEKSNGIKLTYFYSKLDKNLNHTKGEMPKHLFWKIKEYQDKLTGALRTEKNKFYFKKRTNIKYPSVFKHNNYYHFGYVDEREGVYKIVKFEN